MASRFPRGSPSTTDPITGLMLHGDDTRDDQNGDGDDNHLLPRTGNFGDNQGDSAFDNASFVSASAQPRNTTSYEDENRQNEGSLVTVVGDGEGNRGAVPRRQGPSHVADTVSHNVFHFDPPRIPPPQMRAASVDLSRLTTDELMVELGRRGANLREATPPASQRGSHVSSGASHSTVRPQRPPPSRSQPSPRHTPTPPPLQRQNAMPSGQSSSSGRYQYQECGKDSAFAYPKPIYWHINPKSAASSRQYAIRTQEDATNASDSSASCQSALPQIEIFL
jgi:hypothetical protein